MLLTDQGDDDHKDPAELDGGGNDLDFTKEPDREDVDEDDHHPENRDPGGDGHLVGPEVQHRNDTLSGQQGTASDESHSYLQLVCDRDKVRKPIRPAQGKRRRPVDEHLRPLGKGRRQRVHDGHLTDRVTDRPDHRATQQVADEDGRWSTVLQGFTTPQPQSHTNRRSQRNHGQVSGGQTPLQIGFGTIVDIHRGPARFGLAFLFGIMAGGLVGRHGGWFGHRGKTVNKEE